MMNKHLLIYLIFSFKKMTLKYITRKIFHYLFLRICKIPPIFVAAALIS